MYRISVLINEFSTNTEEMFAVQILVVLVLAVVSSSLAQQSEQSGGQKSDRRLALRRFRSRNRDSEKSDEVKENRRQNPRKLANQEEIIKRRKELLQRNNITRRKNFTRKPTVNEVEDETTKRTVRIKSPSVEEDVVVEKISNNDRDIISKVLNQAEAGQDGAPFSGKSEVRTLSAPSGFRSSNEQVGTNYIAAGCSSRILVLDYEN